MQDSQENNPHAKQKTKYQNNRFDHFCEKHNFNKRRFIKVILVVLFVIIALNIVTFGITSASIFKSKTVQFGLKDIGELATQAGYFTSVQSISGSRQILGVDIPLTQNKFVYSYDGVIKAGLDFGLIKVSVDDAAKTIKVNLPEIEILSTEIDEQSFEIFDQENNIFNPLKLGDMNISIIELKKEIREKAISNGLLINARTNAEMLIKGFLAGSNNFENFSVIFE